MVGLTFGVVYGINRMFLGLGTLCWECVRARFSVSCGSCGLRVVGTELVYDCVRPHVGWGFCMGRVVGAVPVFASVRFWPVVFGVWPGVMVRALARKTY